MRSLTRAALRLTGILTAVLLLGTCEFLFYSPAFMPAVSETEVEVTGGSWFERYNGDLSGEWIFSWTPPVLSGAGNITTGWTVPAMEALRFSDEGWHGLNEFLPILFGGAGVSFGAAGVAQAGSFHGSYLVTYDYTTFQPLEYDLPFAAMEGIGESGPTKSLSGAGLTVVETVIYGSDRDELNGNAITVFSGSGPYGLLYMAYFHDNGLVTVAYQKEGNPTTFDAFPDGNFTYVINVFQN